MPKKRSTQLSLPFAAQARRGGRKRRRGRPKKPGSGVPHLSRSSFSDRHPLHVTLRVCRGVYNLRSRRFFRVFERALWFERDRSSPPRRHAPMRAPGLLRIVHYAVLGNHMHLIVEAPDQFTLSRRMQGLEIRVAKRFNRVMNARRGRVFADRYHARVLKTPLEVRRALAYVMGNAAHHFRGSAASPASGAAPACEPDAFCSAAFFDGWSAPVRLSYSVCTRGEPPPVSRAETWLLRTGWKRHGLLAPG